MSRESKLSGPVTVKSAGEVEAVFATLGTVDHDGDWTLPGAFTEGAEVMISEWNHSAINSGAMPVGKGRVRLSGDRVVVDAQYFMDTERGRHAFEVVKALDRAAQWSYGFNILESLPGDPRKGVARYLKRLDVFEASPVWRGTGVGTRTVQTRSVDATLEYLRFQRRRYADNLRREIGAA